jgi:hypothetical protein
MECALCLLPDIYGRAEFRGVRVNESGTFSFNYTLSEPDGDHVYNDASAPFTILAVSFVRDGSSERDLTRELSVNIPTRHVYACAFLDSRVG